ncbi:diacylglycerol kinase family protein [Arthrobacter sp. 35W]|uniref:diacylglycerol kinase family protein n=1 Tax=Arthrobacter sp. 35W TaxID=1132441 RepID=UPI0003F7C063|nr:diacylglycerol kinase family protein [Arthrobacter sp. 35W]
MTTPTATGPSGAGLRIAVAINPRAAFGASTHAGETVVARLRAAGHQVAVLRRGSYAKLAAAVETELAAGAQAVVVVGGDGMVHLGVNAVAGSDVPLGIIPAGTGNDTARGLGISLKGIDAAVDQFLAATAAGPRTIDLGLLERAGAETAGPGGAGGSALPSRIWFAGALSAGFDALVNERANRWRFPRGKARYNLAILRELATLKPLHYRLVVDGVPEELDAVLISISNGISIGGGMKITPDARYDDGMLDLFIVSPLSRLTFLAIFPRVFAGRHTTHPAVQIRRVRSVSIDADAVVGYADGERVGPLPATVTAAPGALKVWC